MKRIAKFLTVVAALAALAVTAQVVLESEVQLVEKLRVRVETTFRNSAEDGRLISVDIRTLELTKVAGIEIKREPGPTFSLTYAQITNVLPGFDQLQATFNAVANSLMTNSP